MAAKGGAAPTKIQILFRYLLAALYHCGQRERTLDEIGIRGLRSEVYGVAWLTIKIAIA